MAYKQKGFPMHSVSALKMDREPRMERRKETMRRDHGEYLDTSNPTTSREIESIERAIREPERDPMAEMRRKKQQGLMDGPVKPPVEKSMMKGANIGGAVSPSQGETTQSTSGMPTFNISDLEGVSDKKKSIAYGDIADTPKNQMLIQKQQELNEWKTNNPDMSDADFAKWQKQMNLIRSQFTHN